jgi:hypothetical protein
VIRMCSRTGAALNGLQEQSLIRMSLRISLKVNGLPEALGKQHVFKESCNQWYSLLRYSRPNSRARAHSRTCLRGDMIFLIYCEPPFWYEVIPSRKIASQICATLLASFEAMASSAAFKSDATRKLSLVSLGICSVDFSTARTWPPAQVPS